MTATGGTIPIPVPSNSVMRVSPDATGGTFTTVSRTAPWTGTCCKRSCWHAEGVGTSYFTGGTQEGVCCRCGTRGSRAWHLVRRQVKGHGPHAWYEVAVYDDEGRQG